MGWITAMHDFLLRWEQERFMREWLALENDYLPIAALKHTIAVPKEVIEHGKVLASTSSRVTQVGAKLLRQSSVSYIVLSVKFQEPYAHKRIASILVHVAWPLRLWQGEAAKEMKSVEENLRWLLRHVNVDFLAHQHVILLGLTGPEKMMKCGFLMPQSRIDMTNWEAELAAEDQFAEMCGTLALGLVAKRHKRLFYLTSAWPNQSIQMMLGLEHAQAARSQFLVDLDLHEYFKAFLVQSENLRAMLLRSLMQTTPCQQLRHGLENPESLRDCVELVIERWRGVLSTNAIEDWNNLQKNNGQMRGSKLYRRPPRAFAVGIATGWLEKKHRYTMVKRALPVPQKTQVLPKMAFGTVPHKVSIDVSGVPSGQDKTTWFSLAAENTGIRGADFAVLAEARAYKREDDIDSCRAFSVSCFSEAKHCVLFARRGTARCSQVD
jgi:hypothetical protein